MSRLNFERLDDPLARRPPAGYIDRMDRQEYLAFVVELEATRDAVNGALAGADEAVASRFTQVLFKLGKAIETYREKSNA